MRQGGGGQDVREGVCGKRPGYKGGSMRQEGGRQDVRRSPQQNLPVDSMSVQSLLEPCLAQGLRPG